MESDSKRPALPLCILATARTDRGHQPDLACLRFTRPGHLETLFTVADGMASAAYHQDGRVDQTECQPVNARIVEEMVGSAVEGTFVVAWDLDATAEHLRAYHPDPEQLLDRAQLDQDLRAAAVLAGVGGEALEPTMEDLATLLSLTPPAATALDQAWFVARAVERFASSSLWLGRVLALGFDERQILRTCVGRLGDGARTYGPWRLEDGRDYAREAYEEVIDGLHYTAAGLLRIQAAAQPTEGR